VLITSFPLTSIIVFVISRFNKELLEDNPLKVYAVRFAAMTIMFLGLVMLVI